MLDKQAVKLLREPSHLRDPLFLFLCHTAWRDKRDLHAYLELVAALDDPDDQIRTLAEDLLHRASPRRNSDGSAHTRWDDLE